MEKTKIKKNNKNEDSAELVALQERFIECENNWKRAVADYHNLKKRTEEERLTFLKFANKEILTDFLYVLDNFEAVLKHVDDAGLTISVNYLRDLFKRYGVEEMNILNSEFNSSLQEATEMVEGDKNKIIEIVSKGYTLNGDVLRIARVKVGKGK